MQVFHSISFEIVIISQLRCFLTFAGQSFNIFNRFACFWPSRPEARKTIKNLLRCYWKEKPLLLSKKQISILISSTFHVNCQILHKNFIQDVIQ